MSGGLFWPIVLQLIGVVVIILEFILPSGGLLGIAALGLFGYSLYIVFTGISVSAGIAFVVIDILTLPILLIVGIKMLAASPVALKESIDSKTGGVSQPPEWAGLKGKEGTAITDLRPAGTALVEGKKYDVVSKGEYVEKGTVLEIVLVDGNRIVVRKKVVPESQLPTEQ
ncbi:MAG: serine protease [Fibrobacter sp.]|jgi:membrane-bound ClpP family serine protease|nr:serine protease [Fibrobacter sp.]